MHTLTGSRESQVYFEANYFCLFGVFVFSGIAQRAMLEICLHSCILLPLQNNLILFSYTAEPNYYIITQNFQLWWFLFSKVWESSTSDTLMSHTRHFSGGAYCTCTVKGTHKHAHTHMQCQGYFCHQHTPSSLLSPAGLRQRTLSAFCLSIQYGCWQWLNFIITFPRLKTSTAYWTKSLSEVSLPSLAWW